MAHEFKPMNRGIWFLLALVNLPFIAIGALAGWLWFGVYAGWCCAWYVQQRFDATLKSLKDQP